MFNEDKTIAAAQKVMLEILQEIHKICVENNLTYWLEAGTLLGAVRHKGFIPWDDDSDVSMPRADYEKFLKIAQEKLPEDMFCRLRILIKSTRCLGQKFAKMGLYLLKPVKPVMKSIIMVFLLIFFLMIIMNLKKL